jgi:hypothetical protein
MKKLLTIILAAASLAVFSCEKDKDDPGKETAEKLHGKWQIDSLSISERRITEITKHSYEGTAADYVEFKPDGVMNTKFRGTLDIAHYTVQSETVILVDNNDVNIRELTDKKLVFYFKNSNGVVGSIEQTYYLKR